MPRLYGFDNQALTRVRAEERQVVREAVSRLRFGNQSQSEVASWMNSEGHRGTMGGEWSSMTLGRLLDNPAIAGLERDLKTGQLRETGRPGLITPEEFLWLQERPGRLGGVRTGEARDDDHEYLYTEGLSRCGQCGTNMRGGRTAAGTPSYREGKGGCGKVRINAELLEDHVGEYLLGELARPGAQAAMEAARAAMEAEAQAVRAEIANLEGRRAELGGPYARGELSRTAFVSADRQIRADLTRERARLRYLEQAVDVPLGGIEDLARWWEHAPATSKRGLAVLLLEKIEIYPARARGVRDVDGRVTLTWRTTVSA